MGTEVWLAVASAMLTLNFGMGVYIWGTMTVRLTRLETQYKMVVAVLISSTIQLHPDKATEVMNMMARLLNNGDKGD